MINKILIVIQRSNGDVFFANTLVKTLFKAYPGVKIDMLINDDTFQLAKIIRNINEIILFSYLKKKKERISQEFEILKCIFRKYDLSISLTASDRSVLYSILASKNSISAVEINAKKSWWKKFFLKKYYFFNDQMHILENNFQVLKNLNVPFRKKLEEVSPSHEAINNMRAKLKKLEINKFFIFHPSAQYDYKVYPEKYRNELLSLLKNKTKIVVTGGSSKIDLEIKRTLPKYKNIIDMIGLTSIDEYVALSKLSEGYIGMDTLNMHISASQTKKVIAIFGPTNIKMWSPWSNILLTQSKQVSPVNKYGNIVLIQANLPCVPCGKAGCNDMHDESVCLNHIEPKVIFNEFIRLTHD